MTYLLLAWLAGALIVALVVGRMIRFGSGE
jgi:hypothetical protein